MKTLIWQKVMQTSITTATTPTQRMKFCRSASIRKSMFPFDTNAPAPHLIHFDNYGHAVVPLLGGIAIRDLNATETKTLGYFSPMQHDGGGYVIQSSYTFLDELVSSARRATILPVKWQEAVLLRSFHRSPYFPLYGMPAD